MDNAAFKTNPCQNKSKSKTENIFLILFKGHKTALAISTEQKIDNNVEQS